MTRIPKSLRAEVEKWRNLERQRPSQIKIPKPGQEAEDAVWRYPDPWESYEAIRDYFAFYAAKMDGCFIDGQRVKPQPGEFYGGWITEAILGPFKGQPGTQAW